ncbi:MAG: formate--tetrahydrofolate ligase [Mycoplasmataceae bacterium]|jgi:formate--tetrahydrofolate ligase|nr:formate--tetrahydrofolate ligase [Mycoplasmataceae bacterium]
MRPINAILKRFKVNLSTTINYGKYIAKIAPILRKPPKTAKLILVTAISPTPAGEGKTTTSIGLNDGLNAIGKRSIVALREPSMGPVFGVKGGANGGGAAQIVPKDDINFHFTGDMHAITAANNLIAACVDNHIYHGNELKIDPARIIWKRVLDMNDRSLREVEITISSKKGLKYRSGFDITVASEIMAILCLATSEQDLRKRIDQIIVAYDQKNQPVYGKDLQITGALIKILQYALFPNAVQSLAGNLAIVHGGPFANIAHGCNSYYATNTALNLAEYVVTEAGFGSDLGAEKFCDIVCDIGKFQPAAVVLVVSTRSLKMHGGLTKDELKKESLDALTKGLTNLAQHVKNLLAFNIPLIVSITQLDISLPVELQFVQNWLKKQKIAFALNDSYSKGAKGCADLAKLVVQQAKIKHQLKPVYRKTEPLSVKISKICQRCYGASGVEYTSDALVKLKQYEKLPYYVCMAKTPISITDDEKKLYVDQPFKIHVKDILIANGAQFIIVMTGNIFRMPGLPKIPEATKM